MPPGQAPGTIEVDPNEPSSQIRMIAFGPDEMEDARMDSVDVERLRPGRYPVAWIDVEGLGSPQVIQRIGELYHLHPLALEDVANRHQRPKVEEYGDVVFVVAKGISQPSLEPEQVSFFIGRNFVITFQQGVRGDAFTGVRQRLQSGLERVRRQGADYLFYELLDSIVDSYFPALEHYGDELERLELLVESDRSGATVARLHRMRHELLMMRRTVWPLREAIHSLRNGHPSLSPETLVYLRDCQDHALHVLELLEVYRESCADLREFYFTAVSHRTNEIMRTLTIIATLFMPLSFVAGVYGMNFEHMPELRWMFGYPAVLTIMASIAGGQLYFFWRRGWLGNPQPWTQNAAEPVD